jgi:beta-lysine N6-acetyltransferase
MAAQDTIERYQGSIIQHGKYNNRIYVIKVVEELANTYPTDLIALAKEHNYSKIFAKIPEKYSGLFLHAGFQQEASIPSFYSDKGASLFMGFFLHAADANESSIDRIEEIVKVALAKRADGCSDDLKPGLTIRCCNQADAPELATIYRQIFQSYPFPIHSPDYIRATMESHVAYFGIEANGRLVAVASAEMDRHESNVEMTDFATLPEWNGNGLAQILLARMEEEMRHKGIKTAYTIARAMSAGINIIFSKAGYQFGGRLKNNTNISGSIESMNVWYKELMD